jgi:pimeloyl-ACP methyl ester carboxylesterase
MGGLMDSHFQQHLVRRHKMALIVSLAALAAGCGGGSSAPPATQATPEPAKAPVQVSTERGALIGSPGQATEFSVAQINAAAAERGFATLTKPAKCAVTHRVIEYNTVGGKGEATNATAGLFIPTGSNPECQGPRPLLMFGHGTNTTRAADPLTAANKSRELSFFAGQGYVVVTPDYTGYAGSRLPYHPYYVAEAQAADAIDALRAARSAVPQLKASLSGKLFLTGVSQGGYVAMAAQRVLERDFPVEFTVTAAAPISGVYAVKKTMSEVLNGRDLTYGTSLFQLIVTSYQRTYGNLYQQPSDVYMAPYANGIETLSPGSYEVADMFSLGLLPQNIFDKGDGAPFLIKSSVRDSLKANPNNNFFVAAAKNDLLDWKPKAPMILCGTSADRMSFFENTTEAAAAFAKQGVTVPVLDLEVRASLYEGAVGDAAWSNYKAARAARPANEPHGMGHAPCLAHVSSFFDSK